MTKIDPEKLMELRAAMLAAKENYTLAYEGLVKAERAEETARAEFMVYANGGQDELDAYRERQDPRHMVGYLSSGTGQARDLAQQNYARGPLGGAVLGGY
jgi:hypothetical protein